MTFRQEPNDQDIVQGPGHTTLDGAPRRVSLHHDIHQDLQGRVHERMTQNVATLECSLGRVVMVEMKLTQDGYAMHGHVDPKENGVVTDNAGHHFDGQVD